jgi:hypothetical protein
MCKIRFKRKNKLLKLLTPKSIIGITLAPFGVYLRDDIFDRMPSKTINHESIHWEQQLEMLIIPFYIWYIIEWILKLLVYGNAAYENLSFEREAYENDMDPEYLKNRKMYAWIKRVFK